MWDSSLYQTQSKKANLSTTPKLFSNKDDDYTIWWLQQRLEEMDSERPDENWELRYDQDRSLVSWNEDGTANVNVPLERATRRLKKADEEASRPLVKFVPTEKSDVDKVNLISHIWDFVWNEADTDKELSKARDIKHIFGTCIWKEYIHTEIRTSYKLKKVEKDWGLISEPKESRLSWVKGKAIDIRNFWVDPVNDFDNAVDCFELERNVSRDALDNLRNDKKYKNIDEALKNPTNRGQRLFNTKEETWGDVLVNSREQKYDLYHYYNKVKGIYIITVNNEIIIREGVNPCPTGDLPYSIWIDEPNYESIYGMGIPEQLETFKYEINYTSNQLLDLVRQTSSNFLMLWNGAAIDSSELVSGVGTILNIDGDIGQSRFQTPPPSDKGLLNVIQFLQDLSVIATGTDPKGVVGDPAKTLGQEEIREITRLKPIANAMKQFNYFLTRMARLRLGYISAYMPVTTGRKIVEPNKKNRTITIKDKLITDIKRPNKEGELETIGVDFENQDWVTEFLEIKPEMIKNNLDVLVTTPATSLVMRQLEKLQLDDFLRLVLESAQSNPEILQQFKSIDLLKEKAEKIGVNVEKFFDNSKEKAKEKQDLREQFFEDLPLPPKAEQPQSLSPEWAQNPLTAL